jgi:hypothetical protein
LLAAGSDPVVNGGAAADAERPGDLTRLVTGFDPIDEQLAGLDSQTGAL